MAYKIGKYTNYLLWGDLTCFLAGLFLALMIRTGGWPRLDIIELHLLPFVFIFAIWILVFYIAGLYEFRSFFLRRNLIGLLVNAQLVNSGIVVLLFYFVPSFLIAPKTVLILDLIITLVLLFGWRMFYLRSMSSLARERALLVGQGTLASELRATLSGLPQFGLLVVDELPVSVVILDKSSPETSKKVSELYPLMFSGVRFLDMQEIYEEIVGRVSLDSISDRWVIENISLHPKPVYTVLKRIMDISIALPLAIISLVVYPVVWLAMKLEDNGPLFFVHKRTGELGKVVALPKFRSMKTNDIDSPPQESKERITGVGQILRKTRIDELPQLWAVVYGNMSLIGPRPEFPHIVERYKKEIPYYDLRHVIKPGLSGWAQILYNTPAYDTKTNREKFAYDLYYVKNRSFILDLKIALRTVKTLLSRVGA